jgi:hypothetical protein
MSAKTIKIKYTLAEEMARGFTQGGETLEATINLLNEIVDVLANPERSEGDNAALEQTCREAVVPLLQAVSEKFDQLRQALGPVLGEPAARPFRAGVYVQALASGSETIESTIDVLNELAAAITNGDLAGATAEQVSISCRDTHIPAMQRLLTAFRKGYRDSLNVNGTARTNHDLTAELSQIFAQGRESVGNTAVFFDHLAGELAEGQLTGAESEVLEQALRSSLVPALEAVSEKCHTLEQEVLETG